MENNKLIGQLRVGLNSLQTDVNEANKILGKIDFNKLKLSIDPKTAQESINYLRLIEKELENIKKSSGANENFNAINKTVTELISSISQMGNATTKVTNQIITGQTKISRLAADELVEAREINGVLDEQYKNKLRIIEKQEKLNSISAISKNQTLSSGNSSNFTFADRFNIAKDHVISLKISNSASNSIDEAYNAIKNYESGLADLSKVLSNITNNDLKAFGQQAIQFSKEFGIPLSEVQRSMTELAKAGVTNKSDLTSMTKSVLTGLNTTEIKNAADMTEYLTSAVNQLGMTYKDTNKIIDSWNKLSDKYAVKSNDLAEATQKAGSASKAFGLDLHTLNALTIVLGEQTQKSGNEIGNALKAMETSMSNHETINTLKGMGIEIMKDTEHFDSFQSIIEQVNWKMNQFARNSPQSNKLIDSLGGGFGKNDILIIANGMEDINKMAKESMSSVGYSTKENEKSMGTLSKQVEVTKNSFTELFLSLGDNGLLDTLKSLITGASSIGEVIPKLPLPESLKELTTLFIGVGNAFKFINSGVSTFTGQDLKQYVDGLLPKISAFNNAFGDGDSKMRPFNASTKELTRQFAAGKITGEQFSAITEDMASQMGIAKSSMNTYAMAEKELRAQMNSGAITSSAYNTKLAELKNNIKGAETQASTYAASQKALGASSKTSILSSLALNGAMLAVNAGISLAIFGITKWVSSVKEAKKAQVELAQTVKQNTEQNNSLINYLQGEGKDYDSLSKKANLTAEEHEKLKSIKGKLAEQFPQLVQGYDEEGNAILDSSKNLKDYINILKEKNKVENDKLLTSGDKMLSISRDKYKDVQKDIDALNNKLYGDKTSSGLPGDAAISKRLEALRIEQSKMTKGSEEYKSISEEIAELEIQRADVLKQINAKQQEQKSIVESMQPYFNAIYNDSNLNEFQRKLLDLRIDKSKFISDGEIQWDSMRNAIKNEIDSINNDPNLNNIKVIMTMETPSNNDLKTYFDFITSQSTKTKKPLVDMAKLFPLKIDSEDMEQSIDDYIEVLEEKMKNQMESSTTPDGLEFFTNQINDLNNLKLQLKVDGSQIKKADQNLQQFSESFKKASDSIQSYSSILSELNENGELSNSTWNDILENHQDLIPLLGDEDALRKEITNRINEQQSEQTRLYNDMLRNSADYYTSEIGGYKAVDEALREHGINLVNNQIDELKNAKDLASAKIEVESMLVGELSGLWDEYYGAMALGGGMGSLSSNIEIPIPDKIKSLQAKYDKIQNAFRDIEGKFKTPDFKSFNELNNKKDSITETIFKASPLNKYDSAIQTINNSLQATDDKISTITQKISYLQSLESKSNYSEIIDQENAKLDEQNNKLTQIQSSKSQANKIKDDIKSQFYANWSSLEGKDLDSLTDSDWTNLYNKMYGNDINLGTGDDAKAKEERYQAGSKLFQDLQKDYKSASELVKKLNDEEIKTQQEINSTIKERIELQVSGYDELLSKQDDIRGDIQDKIDLLEATDNENIKEKVKLMVEVLTKDHEYLDTLIDVRDSLLKQRDSVSENTTEWNLLNEQVENYNEKIDEGTLKIANQEKTLQDEATTKVRELIELNQKNDEKILSKDTYSFNHEEWSSYHNAKIDGIKQEINSIKEFQNINGESAYTKDGLIAKELELASVTQEAFDGIVDYQKTFQDIHNERISQIDSEIAKLDEKKEQEDTIIERQEKQIELEKLKIQLENAKNQKNIQQLTKNQDGTYQFTYIADQEKIDDLNEQYKEKQKDLANWENELAIKKNKEILETEKQYEQDLITAKENYYKIGKQKLDIYYSDTDSLVKIYMDSLKVTYQNKWDEIILVLEDKLSTAKLLNEQLTGLQAQKQNTLDELYSEALKFDSVTSYREANPTETKNKNKSIEDIINEALAFDTGGYTGQWGNEGKLALLHEKELVLKPNDTKNLMETLKLNNESIKLNSIHNFIGNLKLPSFPQLSIPSNDKTQQIIYNFKSIEFPNITNDSGVQNLLDSLKQLPRLATQYK